MENKAKVIYGKEARAEMMEGIDQVADVIGSTMSAKGRNVILERGDREPLIINDGVTCLNEMAFKSKLKNTAVQLFKQASARTNQVAGDGTSATCVLARAILKEGWKLVEKGANPVMLRRQIAEAAVEIEKRLEAGADKVETVNKAIEIATVSVQDIELGDKIGRLMFEVGKGGAVTIKDSIKRGVFVEKDAGLRLEGQLVGGIVDREDRWETRLENARVLILKDSPEDHEFESKWIPFIRQLAEGSKGKDGRLQVTKVNVPTLLVVAEKLSRRFIMAMNQNKSIVKWVWFRPSTAMVNINEIYKDIRSVIGGEIVEEEEGVFLSKYSIDNLGHVETAICGRHELILTVSDEALARPEYLDRVNEVKGQIGNAEDEDEQEQITTRLASLLGGIAAIKVAAATDQDTLELKLRIEDAVNATRVSMEEGYVAGGGVAIFNAAKDKTTDGEKVLNKACESVIKQILHNSGYDVDISKLKPGYGINVLTGETVDMKEEGVIDPLKVVRSALLHSVSVAGLLLTSEYVVVDEEDEDVEALKRLFNK